MRRMIPATFMRGGTSNGVIFSEHDLPPEGPERDRFFIRVVGGGDPFGRQLDGLGGGYSSVSKVLFVGPSVRVDADFDYTFGQVGVEDAIVDYSANCGNMTSAIGPFAAENLAAPSKDGHVALRLFNTNTGQIVRSSFEMKDGEAVETGDADIPGVPGTGAPISLEFMTPPDQQRPALPTGNATDVIDVPGFGDVPASIVDASNLVVFIEASGLGLTAAEMIPEIENRPDLMRLLDDIRRAAGVRIGLAKTPEDVPQAAPKIAFAGPPADFTSLDRANHASDEIDLSLRIISMGRVHKAVTMTGGMCAAAASLIPGTLVHKLAANRRAADQLRIGTPSGAVPAGAAVFEENGTSFVRSTTALRTARVLMKGFVPA